MKEQGLCDDAMGSYVRLAAQSRCQILLLWLLLLPTCRLSAAKLLADRLGENDRGGSPAVDTQDRDLSRCLTMM